MQNNHNDLPEIAFFVAWIIGSSIGAWFLPERYHFPIVLGCLALGVFFDVASLGWYVTAFLTGKHRSGLPGVSLIFYVWFLLASKFSLVASHKTSLPEILMFKGVDAIVLYAFSFLCHLPARFIQTDH